MEKEKNISSGFLIILITIVISFVGYTYLSEKKFIRNSMTITSHISDINSRPRKRILQIRTEDLRISAATLYVEVSFGDTRKIGDQIRLRIHEGTVPQVKVDEFFYLHTTSISILTGCSILAGILMGVFMFQKRKGVRKIGATS